MMMEYGNTASTVNDIEPEEICVREMSVSEILKETRQELNEVVTVLTQIKLSLEGNLSDSAPNKEPSSLRDEVLQIKGGVLDCLGLANSIHNSLFFTRK